MIEVLKQMVEALEWSHGGEPIGTAEAIQAGKQAIAELEQRTWVGLTDDEHCDIWYKESLDWMEYGKAIEAKLREKNSLHKEKNT